MPGANEREVKYLKYNQNIRFFRTPSTTIQCMMLSVIVIVKFNNLERVKSPCLIVMKCMFALGVLLHFMYICRVNMHKKYLTRQTRKLQSLLNIPLRICVVLNGIFVWFLFGNWLYDAEVYIPLIELVYWSCIFCTIKTFKLLRYSLWVLWILQRKT